MAIRNIVHIDRDKCDGCGQCVNACAEGAIEIVDGKAVLVSEVYCDGLGACLGHCPQDAISIEQREAEAFDEKATEEYLAKQQAGQSLTAFVCPGLASTQFAPRGDASEGTEGSVSSQLGQWPVQLTLVPPTAPYFADSDLLLVADCVPLAVGDFHQRFLKGRSVAVGCPKLDDTESYVKKLASILQANQIRSLTVLHMQVPCCSGMTRVAREAIKESAKPMSFNDITVGLQGDVISSETVDVSVKT